ncbi:MAG: TetR family transcriptional regulator [Alphaproteobacteria bacterium]|nr:TetR family transcriptional regulator [Alphaproteobacteria bacterium]
MTASRRDHLVDTALSLFNRDGFHATGIDKILAEAGVAKMTLYNHFRSKEDLIAAALRRRDEELRDWFVAEVERRAKDPRGRLLAIFDVLDDWFSEPDFEGCLFLNACGEYHTQTHPIHRLCAEHKAEVHGYVRRLAKAAGAEKPGRLAKQLGLLMEGATVMAHAAGDTSPARQAKRAAEVLLKAAGIS